jgi:hypothetical protein
VTRTFADLSFQRSQARLESQLLGSLTILFGGFLTGFWQTPGLSVIRAAPALALGIGLGALLYRLHMRTALVVRDDKIVVRGLVQTKSFGVQDVIGIRAKHVMHTADCLALMVESPVRGRFDVAVRSWPFLRANESELLDAIRAGGGSPWSGS